MQLESGQRKLPYMASKRSETRNCLKPVTLYTAEGEMQWVGIRLSCEQTPAGEFPRRLSPFQTLLSRQHLFSSSPGYSTGLLNWHSPLGCKEPSIRVKKKNEIKSFPLQLSIRLQGESFKKPARSFTVCLAFSVCLLFPLLQNLNFNIKPTR